MQKIAMHGHQNALLRMPRQPRAPVRGQISIGRVRCTFEVGQEAVAEKEERGDDDEVEVGPAR